MLSEALSLPFSRYPFPILQPSVMHCHYLYLSGMKNVLIVWRDGRDVMISWYYHCMFRNDRANSILVERTRRDLSFDEPEDIRANLPTFIEYALVRQPYPRFTWADFVSTWNRRSNVVYASYENFRANTANELMRVVRELKGNDLEYDRAVAIAEEFSFLRRSGRKAGQENMRSFMRKGVSGEWRKLFTKKACKTFDQYAGRELILLGYERNGDWVYQN